MRRITARLSLALAIFLLVAFLIFLINQTSQIVALASRLHPAAGDYVFWLLITVYVVCGLVPMVLMLKLPRTLAAPPDDSVPEFDEHLKALGRRLSRNRRTSNLPLNTRAEIEAAIATLDGESDALIKRTSSQVFVTTAVSQNGSLDSIFMLMAQAKMVWQVAHIYYQRPSIRDLVYLYSNVTTTAFMAGELDDIDLSEQIEPIVATTLGSVASAVPGLQVASSIVANSVFSGTVNAFLTLRVGIITRRYCGALVLPEKRALRRFAIAGAAQMLGSVAIDGAKRISKALLKASSQRVTGAARHVGGKIRDTGVAVADQVSDAGSAVTGKIRDTGAVVADQVSDASTAVTGKVRDVGTAAAGSVKGAGSSVARKLRRSKEEDAEDELEEPGDEADEA